MMSAFMKSAVVAASVLVGGAFVTGGAFAGDWGEWRCHGDDGDQVLKLKEVVNYNGSGCPAGSLDNGQITIADDLFSITFDDSVYIAEQGYGLPGASGRKACALRFLFEVPKGFQFSVADVEFRGFASLAKGAKGTQEAIFQFPLLSQRSKVGITKYGPLEEGYTSEGTIPLPSYSRCGEESVLAVNSQVYVGGWNKKDYSSMTVDSFDGVITPYLNFSCKAKRCGKDDNGHDWR